VQFQKSCLVRICFFFVFVVVVVVVPCRVQDERLLDNNPPRRSLVTARLSE
jgi:amino acid permease